MRHLNWPSLDEPVSLPSGIQWNLILTGRGTLEYLHSRRTRAAGEDPASSAAVSAKAPSRSRRSKTARRLQVQAPPPRKGSRTRTYFRPKEPRNSAAFSLAGKSLKSPGSEREGPFRANLGGRCASGATSHIRKPAENLRLRAIENRGERVAARFPWRGTGNRGTKFSGTFSLAALLLTVPAKPPHTKRPHQTSVRFR